MAQALSKNSRTRKEWAEVIAAQWERATITAHQAVEEALKTGEMLIAARAQLGDSEYGKMVREAGMQPQKALFLRNLTSSPIGHEWATTSSSLPQTWTALYELSKLDQTALADAQEKGLVGPETGAREARAVTEAYTKPRDAVVGEGRSGAMLPSPAQAKKIAKATGRTVAGSDGRYHTPMDENDAADHEDRRAITYSTLEAIQKIAALEVTPLEWLEQAEEHWLIDFRLADVETATEWLMDLAEAYKATNKVVEHEH